MDREPLPDVLSDVLAVVLAGDAGRGLHELTAADPVAALFFAGRRRVVDFALHAARAAGIGRALVVTGHRPEGLVRHLRARWAGLLDLAVRPGAAVGPVVGAAGAARTLAALAPEIDALAPRTVLLLPGDAAWDLDLAALLAAQGGEATAALGRRVVALPWGRDPAALVAGARVWRAPGTILPLRTLDAFREAQLAPALPLPPESGARDEPPLPALTVEAGGLVLTAPRFGARRPGRWSVIEDSVVMPGARLADGVRLARAVVAPGAVVPAGLVVGEDPDEDRRWFRVTPGGTTLVTTAMLARRAAERMRARAALAP